MNILEGFEKFTKQGKSFNPKISIRLRGQIGFNTGAVNRFNLMKNQYVVMFYSKEQNKIAFRFSDNPDEDGAHKIVNKTSNYYFSGKIFMDYYGLPYNRTKSYDVEWDEDSKIAIIDLSKGKSSGRNTD